MNSIVDPECISTALTENWEFILDGPIIGHHNTFTARDRFLGGIRKKETKYKE